MIKFLRNSNHLENVDDTNFLGFSVDVNNCTCTFIQPKDSNQIRKSNSAGSNNLLLSGFHSRLHIICRGTYPKHLIQQSALDLKQLYISNGFRNSDLDTILTSVFRKFRVKKHVQFVICGLHFLSLTPQPILSSLILQIFKFQISL